MQIHYGCKRDNNKFMYDQLGPDTGYDCINNYAPSSETADSLNSLIATDELQKTILYSLNPNDNEAIGNFVGMLTDSRSFLSYTRHEYFHRIMRELIGGWVENGEYPADYKALEKIVCGISYNNAVKYFGFEL